MQSAIKWIQTPTEVDTQCTVPFVNLPKLHPQLLTLLQQNGFEQALAPQCALWEMTAAGLCTAHDVCLAFPTGSGKTLAYLLPILQSLLQQSKSGIHCLRALIVLPTNTLLTQVSRVLKKFCLELDLHVGFLGKAKIADETEMLRSFCPSSQSLGLDGILDILLTTPGRLLHHLDHTPDFTLKTLQYLVLDEADHLVKRRHMDCLPQLMERIKEHSLTDVRKRVQKFVVSATVSYDIVKLRMLELVSPRLICPKGGKVNRYQFPEKLQHFRIIVPAPLRPLALVGFLHSHIKSKTIVFCSTLEISQKLVTMLSQLEFLRDSVLECSADLNPQKHSRIVQKFQTEQFSVLVSTDLISRGMDIEEVDWVVSYDTPTHAKTYIHRVGRTARIGKHGSSCCLVRKGMDEEEFNKLVTKLGVEITDLKLDVEELRKLKEELDGVLSQMCKKKPYQQTNYSASETITEKAGLRH